MRKTNQNFIAVSGGLRTALVISCILWMLSLWVSLIQALAQLISGDYINLPDAISESIYWLAIIASLATTVLLFISMRRTPNKLTAWWIIAIIGAFLSETVFCFVRILITNESSSYSDIMPFQWIGTSISQIHLFAMIFISIGWISCYNGAVRWAGTMRLIACIFSILTLLSSFFSSHLISDYSVYLALESFLRILINISLILFLIYVIIGWRKAPELQYVQQQYPPTYGTDTVRLQ